MRMRLPVRLFISYAVVVAIGAAVTYVTVRLLAPTLFDQHMNMLGGDHMGMGPGGQSGTAGTVHSAFISALTTALLVGVLASVAAAGLAAAFVTSRLLRPLNAVRAATRRIAAGHYQAQRARSRSARTGGARRRREHPRLRAGQHRSPAHPAAGRGRPRDAHSADRPERVPGGPHRRRLRPGAGSPQRRQRRAAPARRLADDLSALSRAEEQQLDLKLADTDLASLAGKAASRLAPQFSDAGVTLTVEAGPPLPVWGDPDRITQVLTNIIGNALTATPPGGSVTVQARAHARQAGVAVTDTGVGLATADLERVFERFYRAPGQPRRAPGSGIGLTIARNIARAHGGDVTAASAGLGHGATFTLALPVRQAAARP